MEESQEILFKSMDSYGVVIPPSVTSVRELTPTSLVSICVQCLRLIDDSTSLPTSLPSDSVADRVRICTDIATEVKNLGYLGDISFHKFLYPSEEDLHKLIRFLAERISKLSKRGRIADPKISTRSKRGENNLGSPLEDSPEKGDDEGVSYDYSKVKTKLNDFRLETQAPEILSAKADAYVKEANKSPLIPKGMDIIAAAVGSSYPSRMEGLNKDEMTCVLNEGNLDKGPVDAARDLVNEEAAADIGNGHMPVLIHKIRCQTNKLQNQEKVLIDEVTASTSELDHLERELELMKAAAEMVFSGQHSADFYLDQLNEQLQAKRHCLVNLESEWDAVGKPLEERKRSLEESLFSNNPDAQELLQKLRQVEQEEHFILSEIRKREEEHFNLSAELQKQPNLASRKSYLDRIKEITKNSRKQDADIERILKETREVQLESNSIQERLHRTYAVADEMIFREVKKDPTGRRVYRLLTGIHEGFEQISEKILETDRIRREVAEYETKLAAKVSRSVDVDKLQADLDAIIRENKYLEQQCQDK